MPYRNERTAPAAIAVDFDIFLCNESFSPPSCFYGSQSFMDNNEGFDVRLPTSGHWALYYAYDAGSTACGGGRSKRFRGRAS